MNSWYLPRTAVIGGREYKLRCDFRDVLKIFSYFSDPDLADVLKWQIALMLFYEGADCDREPPFCWLFTP